MIDLVFTMSWLEFAVRWLHVITAIAWIGSSFYFIALDLGIRRNPNLSAEIVGEEWQVHGGGFYNIRKFNERPSRVPYQYKWFKWESYATWLSGAALLGIVYWFGADLYLIDPNRLKLEGWQAILISALSLPVGWLIYDALCRSPLGKHPSSLMVIVFFMTLAVSWGYHQVFTGRAALVHLGAFLATIMSANVFFVIIPNQKKSIALLLDRRDPPDELSAAAKVRSTHNNYLTLPVLYLMLSIHYPLAFSADLAWLTSALVFLVGVLIRYYFNSAHAGAGRPYWTWAAAALIFLLMAWLSAPPILDSYENAESRALTHAERHFASAAGFEDAVDVVVGYCASCHSREPAWEGIGWPPRGVVLETASDVARHARAIYLQAAASHAMPPPNAFAMEQQDRAIIANWYAAATK